MSLVSESKRVALGGELDGLANVASSVMQRLTALKAQFADVRTRAAASPEFTQPDLDEIDALLTKMRNAIRTFVASF
jgi:hypothetical protein